MPIKMGKAVFLLLTTFSLLAGCEFEKSADWYLANKNELVSKLSNCGEDDKRINCVNANKVAESISLAVAKGFEMANRCRYYLDNQLLFNDKIIDVGAACPSTQLNSPTYEVNQRTAKILVNFTGDASGIWLTFTRRTAMIAGMGTSQWVCSTALAYERFMPDICVTKIVYR